MADNDRTILPIAYTMDRMMMVLWMIYTKAIVKDHMIYRLCNIQNMVSVLTWNIKNYMLGFF